MVSSIFADVRLSSGNVFCRRANGMSEAML
jgi:hypothetical protein